MTQALARREQREQGIQISPTTLVLGAAALIALLVWLWRRSKISALPPVAPAGYINSEVWSIEYNSDGLPSSLTIHRNAKVG